MPTVKFHLVVFLASSILLACGAPQGKVINDSNPLELPALGSHGLRAISPTVLELTLITTKKPDPAGVTDWNFVANFKLTPPGVSEFVVSSGGQQIPVQAVGFKRRTLYAPLKVRD